MRYQPTFLLVLATMLTVQDASLAQGFRSGSTGAYGPIDVPSGSTRTLDVPPDGIFHCTTVNISGGATLRFRRNALNTPVYLLATGDVTISGNIDVSGSRGSISAPGQAGPGGFDGGAPGSVGLPSGDGQGPGGGKAGTNSGGDGAAGGGGYATQTSQGPVDQRGSTYGSPLLVPIVGGSGGGGASGATGWGGGGGGGALLIASDTRIHLIGTLYARGGQGSSSAVINSGSGGAIRIVAPQVTGGGVADVRGDGGGTGRGDGRIRVDALDRSEFSWRFVPEQVASVGGLMLVFLDPLPRLDLVEVAGRAVPVDTPTQVILPTGSPATQAVKVSARDFGQVVPIRVVLTPDSGPSSFYDTDIDNLAANPAEVTVNVDLPANVLTHLHVFSR